MEQEITLNQVKYYSEEKYNKDLKEIKDKLASLENKKVSRKGNKRFKLKEELQLCTLFNKTFNMASEPINEDYAVENGVIVRDNCNVCMVQARTEEAKRFLSKYKESEEEDFKEPSLDFKSGDKEARSKYSLDFLVNLINIIKLQSDSVVISLNKDYPIKLENEHFIFILAPRVESE